jgi:peptidoglycan-associated lipoprotein
MKKLALYVLVALAAAACASNDKKETPAAVTDLSSGAQQPQSGMGSSTTQQQKPMGSVSGNPLTDPTSPLSKRSVYFDFDSNAVKDEYRGLVQAHSRYMTTDKRDSRIRIEGNCDERGSREYNLALGQRRAEAVVKSLTLLGADPTQLEAVSFGKERPAVQGENEEAWAKNRRAELASR